MEQESKNVLEDRKLVRHPTLVAVGLLLIGGTLWIYLWFSLEGRGYLLLLFGLGSLMVLTGLTVFQYLTGTSPYSPLRGSQSTAAHHARRISMQLLRLEERLSDLETRTAQAPAEQLEITSEERAQMISSVAQSLPASVAEELSLKFEREIGASAYRKVIRRIFDATVYRLRGEIAALTRRGNLNLVIGVLTTVMAVSLLAYMVLGASREFENATDMMQYYIPRVSTAVFIEVFSFFFLRLYRSSLGEIRYYQDELTRITERRVALLAVEASGASDLLGGLVRSLSEREQHPAKPTSKNVLMDAKDLPSLLEALAKVVKATAAEKG